MILIKYIIQELYKIQLIVLTTLLFVCLCQKFLKMLSLIVDENIPAGMVFLFVSLNVPELGKLIIPVSMFISVPIAFYRLHAQNEILAMYSCAVDKCIFIRSILLFSGIIAFFATINMFWMAPYCRYYQNKLLFKIYQNIDLLMLTEKKFQFLNNRNLMLFVDKIQHKKWLKNIFLVQKNSNVYTIIVSDNGDICHVLDELNLIILKEGICYEIHKNTGLCTDVYISKFCEYQIWLNQKLRQLRFKENEFSYISIYQLWNSSVLEACVELHWRLALLISIVVLPLIATLLFTTIFPNYFLLTGLMLFLCMTFFILHILLRFCIFSGISNPIVWMWSVNILYFIIIGLLIKYDVFYVKKLFCIIGLYERIKM